MHPAKLIIVFCHINELFEKPLSGKVRTKVIGKRLIEYDAKENTRENFESYSKKKNVFFQYIRCSPLASRRFKQPVYLLYQWRIYCNIFLDILHFLRIQEKRGNVNFVLKKTLVMTNVYWKLSDSDLFIAMICVERNSFKSNLRPICEIIL